MNWNMKDENTHGMARATGESMTVAVSEAIRERLERVHGKSKEGNGGEADENWRRVCLEAERLLETDGNR